MVDAVCRSLKSFDYELFSAHNGKEGLTLYNELKPILVILDLKMPVMGGMAFLEKIGLSLSDECAVVVLTGHGDDEEINACYNLGISAFLRKPFNIYELQGIVRNALALKKHEYELKKYRIALETMVEEQTVELRKVNRELKAALQDKELLINELRHRVSDNILIISSLLYLQTKNKDSHCLDLLAKSCVHIRSMSLLHDSLYRLPNLTSIDFSLYIQNLTDEIFHEYGINTSTIRHIIKAENISLKTDKAVYCSLIINELVTNSLKHAFPGNKEGEIYIEITRGENNVYTLLVGDNGTGISGNLDFQTTDTIGLQLVRLLIQELKGTIILKEGRGTSFEITFNA